MAGRAATMPRAPPGLEDALLPAKIDVSATSCRPNEPPPRPACRTQGEWVSAVSTLAPHLDARGLQQALRILDTAVGNIQHGKALEQAIAVSQLGSAQAALAAELVRRQIEGQQLALFQELHGLAAGPPQPPGWSPGAEAQGGAAPAAEPVPLPEADAQDDAGARAQARQVQTLSTSLQLLADEDPECLLIVRRINKLGFKACRKLKQHFSRFGAVVKVLVAHSTVRLHSDPHSNVRRRPSSLGFVHMANPEGVRRILARGGEHSVDGAMIRVQRFERQQCEALEEDGVGACEDQEVGTKSADFGRQSSNYSTISTRTSASTAPSLDDAELGWEPWPRDAMC